MVLHSNFGLSKRTAFHRSPQELAIGCDHPFSETARIREKLHESKSVTTVDRPTNGSSGGSKNPVAQSHVE
jgi:hypothetical protein